MTRRIFHAVCLAAFAVLLASAVLILGVLYAYFTNIQQMQLRMQTDLAARGIENEGAAYVRSLEIENYRITWIDTDGSILYDSASNAAEMDSHLEREEVREALSAGYGESRRYSQTLMERSLYSARRLADGTVVRLSISQHSIFMILLGMLRPICVILLTALSLSVFLAVRISKKIVKPLNEIDLDHPLSNEGYDELSPLLRRIDSQQKQLRRQSLALEQKQKELDTIIGSMNEGMILLNQEGNILGVNSSAMKLLGTDRTCLGADLLTVSRNLDIQQLLSEALRGERAEQVVRLRGSSYQIDASPILSEREVSGIALFFFDVTEKERAEQMRREFTANVSHELKTPLHAISGYAELLKNKMVSEADVIPFAEKIYEEAGRMARLVEDIISLSHLDEGAADLPREEIDLYILAETAVSSLESEADAACVTLKLCGESAVLNGIPQLLYSIIYNLCDNAIKYNRPEGEAAVTIENGPGEVRLSVRDTGIGIAAENQERIFERFYRVDKSRSKEAGGTGLGLSIVKHAAKIHRARIEVRSAIGQGTSITIEFPK